MLQQFDLRSNVMATGRSGPHVIVDPPVRTYDAYYGSASTDSFGGNYTSIMEMYGCGAGAATGGALAAAVSNCSVTSIPTAFLIL